MKTISVIILMVALGGCARSTYHGSDIRDRLSETSGLATHNISIDEERAGIVTLNGNVSSESDRAKIEKIARETRGVKEVRSHLVVDPSSVAVREGYPFSSNEYRPNEQESARRDFEISQNVREAIRRRTDIDLRYVDIITRDGIVTLRGSQNSNRAIDNLVASTRSVSGVREVRNELTLNDSRYIDGNR